MNTIAKVITIEPPVAVNTEDNRNLNKQDCTVADATGCCRLVLWQDHIGKLCEGKSYKMKGLTVRSYNLIKYLNASPTFTLELTDNTGEVIEDDIENEQSTTIIGDVDSVIVCESNHTQVVNCANPKCYT